MNAMIFKESFLFYPQNCLFYKKTKRTHLVEKCPPALAGFMSDYANLHSTYDSRKTVWNCSAICDLCVFTFWNCNHTIHKMAAFVFSIIAIEESTTILPWDLQTITQSQTIYENWTCGNEARKCRGCVHTTITGIKYFLKLEAYVSLRFTMFA